jgi:hypothetical protein
VDADAGFKVIVGEFLQGRDEIQLGIISLHDQQVFMAGKEHVRQLQQRDWMSALFEDLDVQFTYQWFSNGGRFDQYAVTGLDPGGMSYQDVCKFGNTRVCHLVLLDVGVERIISLAGRREFTLGIL